MVHANTEEKAADLARFWDRMLTLTEALAAGVRRPIAEALDEIRVLGMYSKQPRLRDRCADVLAANPEILAWYDRVLDRCAEFEARHAGDLDGANDNSEPDEPQARRL